MPTYSYLIQEVRARFPNLAYIHLIEPRTPGTLVGGTRVKTNDYFRTIWGGRPYIAAGGFTNDLKGALRHADETGELVAVGRAYIANVRRRFSSCCCVGVC